MKTRNVYQEGETLEEDTLSSWREHYGTPSSSLQAAWDSTVQAVWVGRSEIN